MVLQASGWAPLSPDTRVSYAQGSNMQVSRDQVRKQPRGFWKDLGGVLVEEIRPKEGIFAEITWRYLITSPEDEQDQVANISTNCFRNFLANYFRECAHADMAFIWNRRI